MEVIIFMFPDLTDSEPDENSIRLSKRPLPVFWPDSLPRVLVKCSGLGGVQEYIKRNGYF